jgi:hypothetical protein
MKKEELKSLAAEERRRRLAAGLQAHRERREQQAALEAREKWLREFSERCESFSLDGDRLTFQIEGQEHSAILLENGEHVFEWLRANYPRQVGGGWPDVTSAELTTRTIGVYTSDPADWRPHLRQLLGELEAHADDVILVTYLATFWGSSFRPTLSMTVATLVSALEHLFEMSATEMYAVSLERKWFVEFSSLDDYIMSAKIG